MSDRPKAPEEELIEFLNSQASPPRRKAHHLPDRHYSVAGAAYCLTLCARQRTKVFQNQELSRGVVSALNFYRDRGDFKLLAYCLMPDHLHAVLQLRDSEITNENRVRRIVGGLKSYTTTKVAWPLGIRGVLWQRDYYDHIGRSYEDVDNQCRYVLDNPVRKGLVQDWKEHPWSGVPDPWCDGVEPFRRP